MYTVFYRDGFVSYSPVKRARFGGAIASASAMYQRTLAAPIEFGGIGLHTGEHATVRILPAPAGKGIIFRRVDLDNFELLADVASVARVAYATTLMNRGVRSEEHTSELQSLAYLVCRLLLEKKKRSRRPRRPR